MCNFGNVWMRHFDKQFVFTKFGVVCEQGGGVGLKLQFWWEICQSEMIEECDQVATVSDSLLSALAHRFKQ